MYFLKSAQYSIMTDTKRHCYCCKSRCGMYDLVSRVTRKLLSNDVSSTMSSHFAVSHFAVSCFAVSRFLGVGVGLGLGVTVRGYG